MKQVSTRACGQLLRAYGRPFLQYVFDLEGDDLTPERLSEQSPERLEELLHIATKPTFDSGLSADVSFNAMRHYLMEYYPVSPRITALSVKRDGLLPGPLDPDDNFLNELLTYAKVQWPAVTLLCGWHDSRHRLGVSNGFLSLDRRSLEAVSRALLQDPLLTRLFPDPDENHLKHAPSVVASEWMLSPDPGGTVSAFVHRVIDQILLVSAVRLAAKQEPWKFPNFWGQVVETVKTYRGLASGEEVSFPVLVGIGGLPKNSFDGINFPGGHSVRQVKALDSHLLGSFGMGSHTVTLEIPTKISAFEWDPEKVDDISPFNVVEQELNLIRLAILLAPNSRNPIATSRYFTRFLSPRAPASLELWSATALESPMPPSEELSSETVAGIVSQYEKLRPLIFRANHVWMPIRRLLQAAGNRTHPADALVDAFISIEALLSPGKGLNQLTQKLSNAVAHLLEERDEHQQSLIRDEVKRLYEVRSNIVHGNRDTPDHLHDEAQKSIGLAARIIHALCEPQNSDLLSMRASTRNSRLQPGT